jgi:hypothetical protein
MSFCCNGNPITKLRITLNSQDSIIKFNVTPGKCTIIESDFSGDYVLIKKKDYDDLNSGGGGGPSGSNVSCNNTGWKVGFFIFLVGTLVFLVLFLIYFFLNKSKKKFKLVQQ